MPAQHFIVEDGSNHLAIYRRGRDVVIEVRHTLENNGGTVTLMVPAPPGVMRSLAMALTAVADEVVP